MKRLYHTVRGCAVWAVERSSGRYAVRSITPMAEPLFKSHGEIDSTIC
ncbi:MAG TPA: hypothetical protein VFZ27_04295 [Terriglobia bacterium]|nr:hypothetical protein [Terriglobia bacterium]